MSSNEAPLNSDVKDEVVRAPENEVPLTSVAAKIAEAPADLEEGSTQELSWTKEEEARVLRKVDLAIIPWLTFFCAFANHPPLRRRH